MGNNIQKGRCHGKHCSSSCSLIGMNKEKYYKYCGRCKCCVNGCNHHGNTQIHNGMCHKHYIQNERETERERVNNMNTSWYMDPSNPYGHEYQCGHY